MNAVLYLVATPIGNLEDITLRALRVLREEASVIACEDTRQTQKLLDHFNIRKPVVSYHEHNEGARSAELVRRMEAGETIALVSDAGTPLISDPGYRLAKAAAEQGSAVYPIPGASALLAGLAGAGLPTDRFLFAGFPPPKSVGRRALYEELKAIRATLVFYEGGSRTAGSLKDMAAVFGAERPAAVGRELTKLHETFLRGSLGELSADPRLAAALEVGERVDQHRHRQVVDGVVAGVLERNERDALARAGDAADQHEVHRPPLALTRRPPSASAGAR